MRRSVPRRNTIPKEPKLSVTVQRSCICIYVTPTTRLLRRSVARSNSKPKDPKLSFPVHRNSTQIHSAQQLGCTDLTSPPAISYCSLHKRDTLPQLGCTAQPAPTRLSLQCLLRRLHISIAPVSSTCISLSEVFLLRKHREDRGKVGRHTVSFLVLPVSQRTAHTEGSRMI